jgi:hypothetical protein
VARTQLPPGFSRKIIPALGANQGCGLVKWAATQFGEPVKQVDAGGPRITLAALVAVAAGAQDERPQHLALHGSLASLRTIIENNWSVDEYPELFCFGLYQ